MLTCHAPLDEASLSPAVRKAVGAGASPGARMLAARGMAPLPPPDLVVALFQLAHGDDDLLSEAAEKTARELPDAVLTGGLGAPLDPSVLDHWAGLLPGRPAAAARLLGLVLANPRTADETFATLARSGGEALLELIAQNESRLLRHPAIIAALYLNKATRLATALRALELAVRNGVQVDVPSFEELKEEILRDGAPSSDQDQAFAAALRLGGVPPSEQGLLDEPSAEEQAEAAERLAEELARGEGDKGFQDVSRLPMAAKLRLAAIGNAFARSQLVRDSNKVIALAAVRSPALTEQEAERYAANRALYEEVIRHLARQGNFTKRYSVKLNLVNNPKCPLADSIKFLMFLTAKDLKQVARSKSVPSTLAKQAQELIAKRGPR